MRILINIIGVKWGGALTDSYNILKALSELNTGGEYYFFISKKAKRQLPALPSNFHALTFSPAESSWVIHFLYDQLFLPVFVLFNRIDIMLSFNFVSFLMPCPQIIRVTQPVCFSPIVSERMKSQGIRYIFTMFIYRNLILLSIKKADRVIFISEALKQDIAKFIKIDTESNKYTVSYNGIDSRFIESKPVGSNPGNMLPQDKSFKILFPAFYYFHKNFPVLFKAMAELKKKDYFDVRLILTIKPEDMPKKERDSAVKIIKDFNLSQDIVFIGSVPYPGMPRIYKSVDAVVFPSFAEACPNPLPEAMAFGVPIVASDIPVHRELCQDAAIYFDVHNAEGLAENIILLLKNKQLRSLLAENGIKRSKAFSWQGHARKIYSLMEELVK